MGSLSRIVRLINPARCLQVRNITSKVAAPVASLPKPVFFTPNPWIWQKNDKVESPVLNRLQIDFPYVKYVPCEEPVTSVNVDLPTLGDNSPKQAARLIVIRRNKMKRHKLKKLRKRMKFEWARRRQRRELAKEKEFQAVLIKQCKEGESFSAEKYVEDRLMKFNEMAALLSQRKNKGKTL